MVWRKLGESTFAGKPAVPMSDHVTKVICETNTLEVMEARPCVEAELKTRCARRVRPVEDACLRVLAQRQIKVAAMPAAGIATRDHLETRSDARRSGLKQTVQGRCETVFAMEPET